jgi:hypothetical protein
VAEELNLTAAGAGVAQRAQLYAHPDASAEFVWGITAEAHLNSGISLTCRYSLHGDMMHVAIPQPRAGRRADGLWRHTCFEAFVAVDDTPGYFEFNFSPALDWAAYRFDYYRSGMTVATLAQAPGLQVRRTGGQLEVTATVFLAGIAVLRTARVMRLGLAAVIEEDEEQLSYWALQHPAGRPDFHHPDGFALELRPP